MQPINQRCLGFQVDALAPDSMRPSHGVSSVLCGHAIQSEQQLPGLGTDAIEEDLELVKLRPR